jgi:DNA-binding NarL/FixJ family response regulator
MRFILVSAKSESAGNTFLEEILARLGEPLTVPAGEAAHIRDEPGDVWIVDATFEEEVEAEVSRLRNQHPERRIVVMTASPTWARARAAFQAGAIDYLPKTLGVEELTAAIEEIKKRPLPPWPR